jgi:hypothetical protein
MTVNGTVLVKSPRNRPTAKATMTATTTTVVSPAKGRAEDRAPK